MSSVLSYLKSLVRIFDKEYESREDRISAIKEILPYLPRINYTCLRVLVAHLLRVVMSSDKNKMTVRNIAIVFSPTLGIPAGLFTILLAEFPIIFAWKTDDTSRELIAQRNVQRPSISGSKSTTSVQPKFNDLQTHVEEQPEKK